MTPETIPLSLLYLAGTIFVFIVFAAIVLIPFRIYAKLKAIKLELEQTNRLLVWIGERLTTDRDQAEPAPRSIIPR